MASSYCVQSGNLAGNSVRDGVTALLLQNILPAENAEEINHVLRGSCKTGTQQESGKSSSGQEIKWERSKWDREAQYGRGFLAQ